MVTCKWNEERVILLRGDDERDFDELSVDEKIRLVQELWDRIALGDEDVELTQEQIDEAERRLEEHRKNPGETISWEDLRRELEGD